MHFFIPSKSSQVKSDEAGFNLIFLANEGFVIIYLIVSESVELKFNSSGYVNLISVPEPLILNL